MNDGDIAYEFKLAMRRLASTVAIITSGLGEAWTGIAATAVSSLSVDPPTIMVSINRSSSLTSILAAHGHFCVNLLAERHMSLVGSFSGPIKGIARFETGHWIPSAAGLPVLADAGASLICTTIKTLEVHSHMLFIGSVDEVVNHVSIAPLLWVDGRMASASALSVKGAGL